MSYIQKERRNHQKKALENLLKYHGILFELLPYEDANFTQKIIMFFCKTKRSKAISLFLATDIEYKIFRKTIYIIDIETYSNPPVHPNCRCQFVLDDPIDMECEK